MLFKISYNFPLKFLPPASKGWGRLYFHFVCQSTPRRGEGGVQGPGPGRRGYPIQPWTGGVFPGLRFLGGGPRSQILRGGPWSQIFRGGSLVSNFWGQVPGLSKGKNFLTPDLA